MLQRAASNAYSWWWASHVRNNQSKWLDHNLQDMEARIHNILKLLGEEAESFSKRAEMYYKRRPEVMHLVEELYRSYRALVERYDHISKELHKANHTIATAFPEQVQYALLDEGEDYLPKAITPIDSSKVRKPIVEAILKQKRESRTSKKIGEGKKDTSQMSKEKAEEEISKLQKTILALQTEKEFVKSLYENGISKYWELEKQMGDLQEEVFLLQDQFSTSVEIQDEEARTLMTEKILKLCNGVIVKIRDRQKQSIQMAHEESERIKMSRERFQAIKGEYGIAPTDSEVASSQAKENSSAGASTEKQLRSFDKELLEMQSIHDKIKQYFEMSSDFTLDEIVEKVDVLANKAIDLELTLSSTDAQINRLHNENEEFEKSLQKLQEERNVLIDKPRDLRRRLKQTEEELDRVRSHESSISHQEAAVREMLFDVVSCFRDIAKTFITVESEEPATPVPNEKMDHVGLAEPDEPRDKISVDESVVTNGEAVVLNQEPLVETTDKEPETVYQENLSEEVRECISSETFDENDITDEEVVLLEHKEALESIDKEIEALNESIAHSADQIDPSKEELGDVETSQTGNRDDAFRMVGEEGDFSSEEPAAGAEMSQTGSGVDSFEKAEEPVTEATENKPGSSDHSSGLKIDEHIAEVSAEAVGSSSLGTPDAGVDVTDRADALEKAGEEGEFSSEEPVAEATESKPGSSDHSSGLKIDEHIAEASAEAVGLSSLGTPDTGADVSDRGGISIEASPEVINHTPQKSTDSHSEQSHKKSANSSYLPSTHRPQGSEVTKDGTNLGAMSSSLEFESSFASSENRSQFGRESTPGWGGMLLDDSEGGESLLLAEYASVLRNYNDTKKRLTEIERRNKDSSTLIRDLKNAKAMKEVEVLSLKQLLGSSKQPSESTPALTSESSFARISAAASLEGQTADDGSVEDKFRREVDGLQEGNFQFMLRFTSSFLRVQEFEGKFTALQQEVELVKDEKKEEAEAAPSTQDSHPTEKQLRELNSELEVWLEQNAMLRQEVQDMLSALSSLQQDIVEALHASLESDRGQFTPYEAARFQGEVLNMQQENNKLESDLQVASENVRALQGKVEAELSKMREKLVISESRKDEKSRFKNHPGRTRVPLRYYLFDSKEAKENKTKKKSLFKYVMAATLKPSSKERKPE